VRPGVRLFFFDGSGKRTFPVGSFPDMKTASERSLALLRRFAKSPKGVLDTSEEALASSFFGSPEVVSFLSGNPGRVLELVSTGLNRLQGFFPIRVKGGKRAFLFLDVDLSRVDRFELVRVAKERVKRLAGPAFDLGFVDNSGKFSTKTTCGSKVPLNLARKLKAVRVSTDFFYKGRFYSTANLSERIQVFGSRRLPSRYSRFGFWRGVLSTAMFAGIFLMLLLGRADEAEPFSVRARVLVDVRLGSRVEHAYIAGFRGDLPGDPSGCNHPEDFQGIGRGSSKGGWFFPGLPQGFGKPVQAIGFGK